MEEKAKFKIIYSKDADDFLNDLPTKIKDKIIYNIAKAKFVIDPELFKKLDDTDIWEFRTFYNKVKYRLLAFWDKDNVGLKLTGCILQDNSKHTAFNLWFTRNKHRIVHKAELHLKR